MNLFETKIKIEPEAIKEEIWSNINQSPAQDQEQAQNQNSDILSVYEVTRIIDRQISVPALQNIAMVGEITRWNPHTSGHVWFTLKDKDPQPQEENTPPRNYTKKAAILECTLWRGGCR